MFAKVRLSKTLIPAFVVLLLQILPQLWICLQAQNVNYANLTGYSENIQNPFSPDPLFNHKWDNPKATDGLERYELLPTSWTQSKPDSFDTKNFLKTGEIVVNSTGYIRFDFGRVSAGWLEFESDDMQDSISMGISEYNEPAIVNIGAVNRFKTKTPVKHGNVYRLELNPELYEGVRFGWINIITHSKKWHIKKLRLVCQAKPANYLGSFSCSDPELSRIWYTGAYTVRLNLQKDYFGAILMERSDRHSWTGDAFPSQAASMVAFGNYDFVKQNLENTADLNNEIASYSLYWVLSLIDYVNYSGDFSFAKKYVHNVSNKLNIAYQHFGKSPKLGFYGWDERLGAGFENPNLPESQYAYAMLSIRTWKEFSGLAKQLGLADLSQKYSAYASEKIKGERVKKSWLTAFGLHASADAVNTGLTKPAEDSAFFKQNFSDRLNRLSYSPFNQFFIINAMSRMQRYNDALNTVKDCWGGQLKNGATTFYEVYRPSWNRILAENDAPVNNQCGYTSLTHPWSAGVVKWLSEEILGIKPLTPGFKTFEIVPHLGKTLTSVIGDTPTPNGIIHAEFDVVKASGNIIIPVGTVARRIAIPLIGNIPQSLFLNGKRVWKSGALKSSGALVVSVKSNYLNLTGLTAGSYTYKITYKSKRTETLIDTLKWNYSINRFAQDSVTGEKWKGKYGKNGYILYNNIDSGKHFQKLPAYVSSVLVRNAKNVHLEHPVNTTGTKQTVGFLLTKDPIPCLQTMTIDIKAKDNDLHQVALYFWDWNNNGRRSAVEVFDLKTLKILSPVQMIGQYQNGKYLVFSYTGDVRIRINQVRGDNAALSNILFD